MGIAITCLKLFTKNNIILFTKPIHFSLYRKSKVPNLGNHYNNYD